mmetsp:Transcript_67499/g.170806  ORF Transcript_67499/g.170806 Transcript_67499/m.170806 type:complete len:241 (-) Transcript_67499:87-809(-)
MWQEKSCANCCNSACWLFLPSNAHAVLRSSIRAFSAFCRASSRALSRPRARPERCCSCSRRVSAFSCFSPTNSLRASRLPRWMATILLTPSSSSPTCSRIAMSLDKTSRNRATLRSLSFRPICAFANSPSNQARWFVKRVRSASSMAPSWAVSIRIWPGAHERDEGVSLHCSSAASSAGCTVLRPIWAATPSLFLAAASAASARATSWRSALASATCFAKNSRGVVSRPEELAPTLLSPA